MSQSCYIVAVWHRLKTQILHKIKQNTIAKNIDLYPIRYYRYFFPVSVFVFFQIPQQPISNGITNVMSTSQVFQAQLTGFSILLLF
jgi:hypothetical protein